MRYILSNQIANARGSLRARDDYDSELVETFVLGLNTRKVLVLKQLFEMFGKTNEGGGTLAKKNR